MSSLQVLFVCTGNICRSPSAEGVLRHHVIQAGLEDRILIDSAGTHDYHSGDNPTPQAIRSCAKRGYDLSGLTARKLSQRDFEAFDLILAMDRGHLGILQRLCPTEYSDRVRLYLDYASEELRGRDVPDPYYGGPDDYELMLDLIEAGMTGLMTDLQARL